MNITVFNDTIGSPNFGCQLVSNSIRKAISDTYPGSTVDFIPMHKLRRSHHKPDIVIINGEGSFGHVTAVPDGFRLLSFVLNNYKGIAPVYLVNCSVQVPVEFIPEAENLLKECDVVSLREMCSYNFLKENTKLDNLKVFPDLGTYMFKDEKEVDANIDIVFGFGALLKFLGVNHPKIKEYVEVFNELAEEGYTVKAQEFPGNPMNDLKLIAQYTSDKVELVGGTYEDYFNTVKRAKLNVTGRHHGAVMSFIGRTPFYTFESNMWKTEGDQLMYGPFNQFIFKEFNKAELKENIITELNKYETYKLQIDKTFNTLYNLFDGHIRVTNDLNLKGLESK